MGIHIVVCFRCLAGVKRERESQASEDPSRDPTVFRKMEMRAKSSSPSLGLRPVGIRWGVLERFRVI